jgi:SAM-dependent methyltransferase
VPTSNLHLAPRILNLVETVPHQRVLDIGPGHGKYATLLREYLNSPPVVIDAVEAWAPYVERHRLRALYDRMFVGDATEPVWHNADPSPSGAVALVDAGAQLAVYDVVLMVDVIEHMPQDRAASLIRQVRGRVVICTPVEFFDNGPGLPPTETHVSHWTRDDIADLGAPLGRDVEYVDQEHGGWVARLGPTDNYRAPRVAPRVRAGQ